MVLRLARPHKHPKTSVYYFRQKVPSDLRAKVRRAEVTWSLGAKDPEETKLLHGEAARAQALKWQAMRSEQGYLPHKQIVALAGTLYRAHNEMLENEPEPLTIWDEIDGLHMRVSSSPSKIKKWYGFEADRLLQDNELAVDDQTRFRFIEELHQASLQWAANQRRRAAGDYRPDPDADRFPPWEPSKESEEAAAAPEQADGISLTQLFVWWKRDHLANGKPKKTADDFGHEVRSFVAYLGHDDAEKVTGENVSNWCDQLRNAHELAARTVSDEYLAAIKAIYRTGAGKRTIAVNTIDGVRVKVSKALTTRSKGFTDNEAKDILRCARDVSSSLGGMNETNRLAIRWGPWICAYTGARVTEVMQLRREDLMEEHGIVCIRITPEAGSVKTGNCRLVPLHPLLIEMGLPEVILARSEGPIFFVPKPGGGDDPAICAANVGKKVGRRVREVVRVTDPRVWPSHGWRHRFKTVARDVGIDPHYSDAIVGHEDGRASTSYGETSVKALLREVRKLPRYEV